MTKKSDFSFSLFIVMCLFFICGLSSVLQVILNPYLQKHFHLSYKALTAIQIAYFSGYFLMSPMTLLLFKKGYITCLRLGAILGLIGSLTIAEAGLFDSYYAVLLGVLILGSGISVIQVVANPYIILLGSEETASSRLSFSQASTSVGMVLAPYIGTFIMLSSMDTPDFIPIKKLYYALALSWGIILALISLFYLPNHTRSCFIVKPKGSLFLLFGLIGIAVSVGIEISVGSFLFKFLEDPNVGNIQISTAGYLCIIYWLGFVIGRIYGSYVLKIILPEQLMMLHATTGLLFILISFFSKGLIAGLFMILLGLCTSVMFPIIFSTVLENYPTNREIISVLLCMANIGGAFLPFLQGVVADTVGIHLSFFIPLLGYSLLIIYGKFLKDYRLNKRLTDSTNLSNC